MLVARADDAARAVTLVERLRQRTGADLRAGVSTGLIWVGEVSGSSRAFVGVVGDTANQGARLMAAAAPGTTLVEDRTRRAAGASIVTSSPQLISVKGKTEPLVVHAVESVTGVIGRYDVGDTALVGRTSEVDRLVALLTRPGSAAERVVEVLGAAGIGKTRIVAEATRRAELVGCNIERHRFDGYGIGPPFGPFVDVVTERLGLGREWSETSGSRRPTLDEIRAALAGRVAEPDLGARLLGPVLGVEAIGLDAGESGEEWSELTTNLVVEIVGWVVTPTVLVLDDAQWVDASARAVLSGLARSQLDTGLTVVVVRRTDDHDTGSYGSVGVSVEDLDAASLGTIVADTWSMLGGADLDESIVADIVDRSAGNPLIAAVTTVQVRRQWSPGTPVPAVPLYEELLGALTEQLDGVPEELSASILLCGVVGRPATVTEFAEISGRRVADLTEELNALAAWGLIVQRGEHFELRQTSLAEVIRQRATHKARAPLHRDVASWLERHGSSPREIAGHLAHCSDEGRHLFVYRAARDDAHRRWNVEEAVEWADRIVEHDDHGALDLLVAAELALVAGDARRSEELLDAAEAMLSGASAAVRAVSADDDGLEGAEAELLFQRGKLALETGRAADGIELLRLAESRGSRRTDLGWPITMALCDLGRFGEAEALARRGVANTSDRIRLDALANLGVVQARRGDLEGAKVSLRQAADLAEATGDMVRLLHATNDLAGVSFESGDLVAALRLLGQADSLAQRVGAHRAATMALGNQAQVRMAVRDLVGAARVAAAAAAAALRLPDVGMALSFIETNLVVLEASSATDEDRSEAARRWATHARLEAELGRLHEAAISTFRSAALEAEVGSADGAVRLIADADALLAGIDPTPDSDAHRSRALRAIAGEFSPPPELDMPEAGGSDEPIAGAEVVLPRIDSSVPAVTAASVDELLDRAGVAVAAATRSAAFAN